MFPLASVSRSAQDLRHVKESYESERDTVLRRQNSVAILSKFLPPCCKMSLLEKTATELWWTNQEWLEIMGRMITKWSRCKGRLVLTTRSYSDGTYLSVERKIILTWILRYVRMLSELRIRCGGWILLPRLMKCKSSIKGGKFLGQLCSNALPRYQVTACNWQPVSS
jgi:hypothetical protein